MSALRECVFFGKDKGYTIFICLITGDVNLYHLIKVVPARILCYKLLLFPQYFGESNGFKVISYEKFIL